MLFSKIHLEQQPDDRVTIFYNFYKISFNSSENISPNLFKKKIFRIASKIFLFFIFFEEISIFYIEKSQNPRIPLKCFFQKFIADFLKFLSIISLNVFPFLQASLKGVLFLMDIIEIPQRISLLSFKDFLQNLFRELCHNVF